jgi:LmbE family N-acetylglucosaminyl deacetylase
MQNNTLIVAPHPDDEILGCGGTIKKLTSAGGNVIVLIISRGKKGLYSDERILNVRNEARNAHKILGVTETRFLEFPAPDLHLESLAEISGAITEVITGFDISALYLPHHGDIHSDKRIYSYETLSETEWAGPSSDNAFIPTHFVNISDIFYSKLEAMRCFKSQLREFPNPRSLKAVEALANLRGSTVGFHFAEAFVTIRVIED